MSLSNMKEKCDELVKMEKNLASLNTNRGGSENGLKGFVSEITNTAQQNISNIDKSSSVRERVIDDNGPADALIKYKTGNGRKIQYKEGYTISQVKSLIEEGKYDEQILRLNPEHPIFDPSNATKRNEIEKIAREHNISIQKGKVLGIENKKLAKAMRAEGKIRTEIGLKGNAPVVSKTYANIKKAEIIVEDGVEPFAQGAIDTVVDSVIPLTTEAVRKMVNVSQGKQSFKDAAKDMGKITLNVAVVGGTKKLTEDIIKAQLSNSKNTILKDIVTKDEVAQLIAVASIVQESAIKYINGELSSDEFISEVGEKGATMVAGMIGGQIGSEIGMIAGGIVGTLAIPGVGTVAGEMTGKVIGQIIGTIITTVVCSGIAAYYGTLKHLDDYKVTEKQIRKIEKAAIKEMENQRIQFRRIVENEYKIWDFKIQSGFDQLLRCACEETCNIQGITEGIDTILSIFGEEARFHNVNEYKAQLNQTLTLSF